MRKLIFAVVLLVSMLLPQIPVEAKKDIYSFAVGVPVVVDNNIDVTYTGKTWKDAEGNNKYEYVARISQAPVYNDDGTPVDCSWHGLEDAYAIVNNVFSAQVIGAYITTTYHGQSMSWNPIVLVDSKEYVAKGSPKVLAVDPINSNYRNNTLEWDYGVCVRRVRVIEGLIQETWIFASNPKGTVWIKDNAQKSAGFTWAIQPYAYDALNNAIPINQYKQVMATDMAKAVYPVTIDPTEVYVTSASDGDIYSNNCADATGTVRSAITAMTIGDSGGLIFRDYLYFDTSALPDSCTITAVNTSLYGITDVTATDVLLYVTQGMPTYPHDPLVTGDFDKTHYSGLGNAGFNTSGFNTSGYNNISLNASGIAWMNKIGTTKLSLVTSADVACTEIGSYVQVYTYEQGAGYRPTLYVTYSSSGVPTVTTNPATYVTKTTAQLNGYVDADGGEADTVSFNYHPWYNQNWSDCIEFTINASYVDADLTNFPVLVTGSQLNTTDTDFWTTVDANGSDILFTSSNGVTKLNRELVSINTTAMTMECYVNVTSIDDTTDTKFYMYYGANVSLYNESNSISTWDANYVGVWHMNDNPNTSTIQDSTYLDYDMTKKGANEPLETIGNFGGDKAELFDATDDYLINTTANWQSGDSVGSFLVLYNILNISGTDTFWASSDIGTATSYIRFTHSAGISSELLQRNAGDALDRVRGNVSVAAGWNLDIIQSNSALYSMYRNNVLQSLSVISGANNGDWFADTTLRDNVVLGAFVSSAGTQYVLNGSISEARCSNISRSAGWIDSTYHTLMQPTSFAPVTDVFTTTTTQSKNTGDSYYISQTGLTANTLYGYKSEATNSYGTSWGQWVLFNTSVTLNPPSNVLCNSGSNSIDLSWTKGGNSSYTHIRYKIGSYPTSSTDGNAVANQSGVNFTHTGLASGTSYYYRLWGEDGGTLSTTNVTTMCTTTAGSSAATAAPLPTLNMSGATTAPNGSALTNNPLYALGNQEAAAISVPQATWWMLVGLGILIITGLFIYTRSRNLLLSLGAMIIVGVIMANMGMFPIWVLYVFGVAGIGMSWKELR